MRVYVDDEGDIFHDCPFVNRKVWYYYKRNLDGNIQCSYCHLELVGLVFSLNLDNSVNVGAMSEKQVESFVICK